MEALALDRAPLISGPDFYIDRKYMPEAISTPNAVALPITSQELGRGAFFPSLNQNIRTIWYILSQL